LSTFGDSLELLETLLDARFHLYEVIHLETIREERQLTAEDEQP
jgi:hypothetical protein